MICPSLSTYSHELSFNTLTYQLQALIVDFDLQVAEPGQLKVSILELYSINQYFGMIHVQLKGCNLKMLMLVLNFQKNFAIVYPYQQQDLFYQSIQYHKQCKNIIFIFFHMMNGTFYIKVVIIQIDFECQIIILIMDFIKNHSRFFVAATASSLAALFAIAYFFKRRNQAKQIVSIENDQPYDLLKKDFSLKIQEIRSKIIDSGLSKDDLANLSLQFAKYIQNRTRYIEQQNYSKAVDWKLNNQLEIYVNLILVHQKQNETLNKTFIAQQQEIISSLHLNSQQVKILKQKIQSALKDNLTTSLNDDIRKQAKIILSGKNQYLKTEGEKLVNDLVVVCKTWNKQNLKYLPNILNIIINEQVYSKHPESIDNLLQINWTIQLKQRVLLPQLQIWQQLISPLYQKISSELTNKDQ